MIENTFFQTTKNIEKAGAYYTDVEHCERLSNLFDFGTGDVCILEPSAGNGEAVKTITKNCINRKIFAVELSTEAYIGLKNDQDIFEAINCDFLQTKISHKSFSFCFANPPYIDDEGRMEIEFLKRIANYMSDGGILAYIVPYSIATNKSYLRTYLSKFEPIFEFRFDDAEYAKYRQIAFIGKRKTSSYDNDVLNEYLGRKKEDFPLIPKQWDKEKIIVGESKEENITFFTSLIFDEKLGYENLLKMKPQKNNLKNIAIEPFKDDELSNPPIMPNENSLYLLSTLGCGSGITGTAEDKDVHLQRGCAKIVKNTYQEENEDGSIDEVVRTSTQVSVTILENNGNITILE